MMWGAEGRERVETNPYPLLYWDYSSTQVIYSVAVEYTALYTTTAARQFEHEHARLCTIGVEGSRVLVTGTPSTTVYRK